MAVDMFLKLDGIDGDSTAHKHKGEIELLSYSWGLSQTLSSPGGGGGAGKVNVSDFSITKQIDASSPKLMEACCQGQHIKDGTLTVVTKGGQKQEEYLVIKLTDILVSSYQTGGNNTVPMDQVTLNFASVDIAVSDRRGGVVSQVSCDFHKLGGQLGNNHNDHD